MFRRALLAASQRQLRTKCYVAANMVKVTQTRSLLPFSALQQVYFSTTNKDETAGESVRNKEIEFYSNLNDWWGENCPQAQLHKFNKVRVNFVRKHLLKEYESSGKSADELFAGMKVLDVGCGAGILAEGLGRLGMGSVTGIDPTPKCIELADAHLALDAELSQKVNYRNVSIEHVISEMEQSGKPEEDCLYDLVCCSEVIEHVNDQQGFLHKCIRMVKPGGHFFLSSIAKTPEGWFLNIVMGEYVLGLLPKGTHEWDLLITPETVEKHLSEVNCTTLAKTGATILNPITREMGEIPYTRANYLMMSKKAAA